ncbi:MAG: TetR/AcrR family transcriptional regulator [Bacteroidetes bacterium]|nr:MAG: TetR/AcrR family transcriptional regulator [Bacteroidota bacterium]
MKKSEQTRRHIIEKAAVLFNTKGFHGTSIGDIMAATGLTKGGIYGNFKKEGRDKKGVKEEIAVAAFEHAVQVVWEEVRRRTKVIENTLDKLKSVVYFYKERCLNPPVDGGCPIQNTAVEAADNHPVLREKVLEVLAFWRRRIVETLEEGKRKGEVRPDVDSAEFAVLFIGMLEGGILLSRVEKNIEAFGVMSRRLLAMIEELRPV